MSMRQGAFCVPLEAHPLPIAIKRKWAEAKDAETRSASLENIEFKLQAAEQRREVGLLTGCASIKAFPSDPTSQSILGTLFIYVYIYTNPLLSTHCV